MGDGRAPKHQGRRIARKQPNPEPRVRFRDDVGYKTEPRVVMESKVSVKTSKRRTTPRPLKPPSGSRVSNDQHLKADQVGVRSKRRRTIGQKNCEMAREITRREKESLPAHSNTEEVDEDLDALKPYPIRGLRLSTE